MENEELGDNGRNEEIEIQIIIKLCKKKGMNIWCSRYCEIEKRRKKKRCQVKKVEDNGKIMVECGRKWSKVIKGFKIKNGKINHFIKNSRSRADVLMNFVMRNNKYSNI